MAQERRFVKGLSKPGVAAQVRETVSQTIRDSACLNKPRLVEPVDYETYIVKNKTILQNDPHREMVLFPHDDVSQTTLPRRLRTLQSTIPENWEREVTSLFVRECINTYSSNWSVVHYKYSAYGGDHKQFSKSDSPRPSCLQQHVFEVDAEAEDREESNGQRAVAMHITKKGWLYKGPDTGQDTGLLTKSFKRRYFYLKQQADTTYVLEFHKDDKKLDAKGTIFLDSAIRVAKGSRRGKSAFELHMQDKSAYILGTDNDQELEDWVGTLKKVIQSNDSVHRHPNRGDSSSPSKIGTLRESLEHSMNPELQKYARETDSLLAMRRKEGRQNLFSIYPGMQSDMLDDDGCDEDVDVYREQFGTRFIVRCEDFTTRLLAAVNEEGQPEKLTNPEPFFISISVYDAKEGRKLSEDFHYDPNPPHIREMVPQDILQAIDKLNTVDGRHSFQPHVDDLEEEWLSFPKQGVFSVSAPHNEIYLVARLEKVLQGSLSASTEPYVRTPDTRLGTKIHRQMKQYCSRIGLYRMPFAWAARPVFKQFSGELDTYSEFSIYRQEAGKTSDEDLIRHLQDMKKPERQSKWQSILGTFKVKLYTYKATLQYTLTPSLQPVRPFEMPPEAPPTFEVQEFSPNKGELVHPYTSYVNNLFVYPKSLKYDTQKSFPKARNIACCIEIRSSDEEGAVPLKCLYGRPGSSIFTTTISAAVLHHDTTPTFNDEVKLALPVQLHERHHLLFTFYHISCEAPKTSTKGTHRKSMSIESPVGCAWLPLLVSGRVCNGERSVPVAVNLPPGYLSYQQLGLGKGQVGPEIKWVDGGKPLFKVKLNIVSTVYTTDQHLHNFFSHCQKLSSTSTPATDMETSNKIKSLHAVDITTLVNFLPTLLNQLLRILPSTNNEDVASNTVRVLIHIVSAIHEVGKIDIISSYVKYVFVTTKAGTKSIHEELVKALKSVLRPTQADSLLITKFLRHAWFFFQLISKSMAQHLLTTGRIKMSRNERFPSSYQFHLQTLLQILSSHITHRHKDALLETRSANTSLALFIKTSFTYLDRGFVFKMINMYMDSFGLGDPKILHEYKFEFLRIVCNQEHYIALNLPILTRIIKNYRDLKNDYLLSDEFRQKHFLAGMVLHELRLSLNEIHDIRKIAISLLRNLLAKHAGDDRYQAKQKQARIANLYLPLIGIVLENCNRLDVSDQAPAPSASVSVNGDTSSTPDTPTAPSRGSSMISVETNSIGTPRRDPNVLALIAGHGGATAAQTLISEPQLLHQDSDGSVDSSTSSSTPTANNSAGPSTPIARFAEDNDSRRSFGKQRVSTPTGHKRAQSLTNHSNAQSGQPDFVVRYDKLNVEEVQDLLICFLHVVKHLSEDVLLGWFHNSPQHDIINFLTVLQICLKQFKYIGKRRILQLNVISDSRRAMTLPAKKSQSHHSHIRAASQYGEMQGAEKTVHTPSPSEADAMFRTMLDANLSSEVALIVLDILSLYVNHFTEHLHYNDGENPVMEKVLTMYLTFLQSCQSESTQGHAFASLRAFINKFPAVLFLGDTVKCGQLCYEILRCCNSRLISTRSEACALMYLLMRTNFEFSRRKSFTRVHLQMIIAVSQLITDVEGLCNARFFDSLSVINNFANSDVVMKKTPFVTEVKDVTKRIREVLMATAKLKEHENNPEMYVDLQYRLAKSYASTPELRKTWLESMAKTHRKQNNFSEAAHCYLHVAALLAEYLRRKGCFPQGCQAFRKITPNIEVEEMGMRTDESDLQDVQYSEAHLCDVLEDSCQMLEKAERYEVLLDVYELIIPIYKYRRDYEHLARVFSTLQQASQKITDVMHSGRRLLGRYFRVAFYGQSFFEEEHGKEYIYKEPKVTGLTEICDRLYGMYTQQFGKGKVKIIDDTNKDMDPQVACVLVTFVTPFFDDVELEDRRTDFEKNNNIRQFMYETPFTKSGSSRGEIEEQYKRRTILTTTHAFPYVTKRIPVVYRTEVELTPIEVAIDEMQGRVSDLESIVFSSRKDLKKLQLKLQGSVSVQVNAGPVAYAEAFLASDKIHKYNRQKVATLKQTFRDFVYICSEALQRNAQMISSDQFEYQEALTQNFNDMASRLSLIMGEQLMENEERQKYLSHRSSLKVFSVISSSSSTA